VTLVRVAALYVLAKSSHYAEIEGVDLWPMRRDARLYGGPWPVVAHPPCGHWSRYVSHRTHETPEHSPDLAPLAVRQVRTHGGVLEHVGRSLMWDAESAASRPILAPFADDVRRLALPRPAPLGTAPMRAPRDKYGGFSIEVRQAWWGDKRWKLTWLYFCHVDPKLIVLPKMIDPPPPPTDIPKRIRRPGERAYARSWSDKMGATERKRTVPAMAKWLVEIAATAQPPGPKAPPG
jgi:hypothetical protein